MEILNQIWERQAKFQANFMDIASLTKAQREAHTKDFLLYVIEELLELARNMDWKTHRKIRHDQVATSNIREELIDIYKYWLSIALIWELTPEQFVAEFDRKSEVVEQRWAQEFSNPYDSGKYNGLIIVDIDGVLADYVTGFTDFVDQSTGLVMPRNVASYDLYGEFGIIVGHEKVYDLKHQFRESGLKAHLPVIDGARDFLHSMKLANRYILLMSARPYKKYKRIMADTMEWLKKNDLPFNAILWDENKEERVVKEYHFAEFVVEDHIGNAKAIASKGVRVYLRDTSYNQGSIIEGMPIKRFKDYDELKKLLETQ